MRRRQLAALSPAYYLMKLIPIPPGWNAGGSVSKPQIEPNHIARRGLKTDLDNNPVPVHIVFSGDFFQLPPIVGKVPQQTWCRLREADLKQGRAVLTSGLDGSRREVMALRVTSAQAIKKIQSDLEIQIQLNHLRHVRLSFVTIPYICTYFCVS